MHSAVGASVMVRLGGGSATDVRVGYVENKSGTRQVVRLQIVFFFQAEDGIRDYKVTGVQTCALPIFAGTTVGPGRTAAYPAKAARSAVRRSTISSVSGAGAPVGSSARANPWRRMPNEIGRASCRERV